MAQIFKLVPADISIVVPGTSSACAIKENKANDDDSDSQNSIESPNSSPVSSKLQGQKVDSGVQTHFSKSRFAFTDWVTFEDIFHASNDRRSQIRAKGLHKSKTKRKP